MPRTISASVGRAGVNRPMDVQAIQDLLNKVPTAKGGPGMALVVDGACGPKTTGAIDGFQRFHFGRADGRVDPYQRTLSRLNEFDSPGSGPAPAPVPSDVPTPASTPVPGSSLPQSAGLSELRQKIIQIAVGMATPAPGKVSDLVTAFEDGKTVRAGWRYLKDFFDVAVENWTEAHWRDPANLAGVQIPGKRIPQKGRSGISWCGIFATWVWIKAGMPVKWRLGPGVTWKVSYGQNARPGDILVLKGDLVHHCISVGLEGGTHTTVNGNSDNQSILIKPVGKDRIAYFYSVD